MLRFALLQVDKACDLYHVIVRKETGPSIYDSDEYSILTRKPMSKRMCDDYIDGAYEQIIEIRQARIELPPCG